MTNKSTWMLKKLNILIPLIALFLLSGCYDMTIKIKSLPSNTPPSDQIYISGNFNNWDPGDPAYQMSMNADSVYEIRLPRGIGEVQYKFTRGDWSTVEKDICGYEISNRTSLFGKDEIVEAEVLSWNDLPKPLCPKITIVVDSLPANTPEDAALYIAGNFNDWDPGSRLWMFSKGPDGKYYIEIPRPHLDEELEFKITRGNWWRVECQENGDDIDNRIFRSGKGDKVQIVIKRWKDL